MVYFLAWRQVTTRCRRKRSTFNKPSSVSLQALPLQSPRPLMKPVMAYFMYVFLMVPLAYWRRLSL